MRKTKIICTIGPASENEETLTKMCQAGMDVARLNFSHGSHEEHQKKIDLIKKVRKNLSLPIAIMLDTKGPEYRIKTFENGKIQLEEGATFTLTTEDIVGNEQRVAVNYKNLIENLKVGDRILVNNGLIILEVTKLKTPDAICKVIAGGELSDRKSMNFPNKVMNHAYLSEQDKQDLLFGIQNEVDFVAASFVSTKQDVADLRAFLDENGGEDIDIIAKIENRSGVDHVEEICEIANGIMIARGDLGVEIPAEEVPYLQKMIIQKCNSHFKTVITATQMLDSMIRNPRPTRAEVTDVANAVYDGTDAVMLSVETAQGKYPVEALQMMVHIIENTEQHLDYEEMLEKEYGHLKSGVSSAIGYSSVLAAANLNAKCILTPTVSGATARVVSNLRPRQEILGITPNERTLRRMSIYWGVRPLKSLEHDNTEDICENAMELAKVKKYVEQGDVVVLTAGIPSPNVGKERSYTSNMMRIATID